MSTTSQTPLDSWQPPPFPVRRFTVEEYHRMISAGVFADDERFELLEGWIVPKMTHSPRHDAAIDQIQETLRALLPEGWRVRIQSAITTLDSEPEPDLTVVPGPASRYKERHPGPEDIALVIEVADSSLASDRGAKGRLYGRAGIPVYWVVNLVDSRVEVDTDPVGPDAGAAGPGYRQRTEFGAADSVPLPVGCEPGWCPGRALLP